MLTRNLEVPCKPGRHGGLRDDARAWEDDETLVLLQMHAALGNQWHLIASQLQDRSPNSVRNRFLRLKKNSEKNCKAGLTGNNCQKCGLKKRAHLCTLKMHIVLPEQIEDPLLYEERDTPRDGPLERFPFEYYMLECR